MPKSKLTQENIEFIKANRLVMSGKDMADKFGVYRGIVNRYMQKNGLAVSKETIISFRANSNTGRSTVKPGEDEFIKANYLTMTMGAIEKHLGRYGTFIKKRMDIMGLVIPAEILKERRERTLIKKGNIPFNKEKRQSEYMSPEMIERTKATRFKKGQLPHNSYEKDGIVVTRIDSSGIPYQYIRVSLGKWELYHRYLWMKVNGPVPPKHCLWFKDGNAQNCSLDNIELITRKENRERNKIASLNNSPELKQLVQANKNLLLTIKKVQKNGKQRIAN